MSESWEDEMKEMKRLLTKDGELTLEGLKTTLGPVVSTVDQIQEAERLIFGKSEGTPIAPSSNRPMFQQSSVSGYMSAFETCDEIQSEGKFQKLHKAELEGRIAMLEAIDQLQKKYKAAKEGNV